VRGVRARCACARAGRRRRHPHHRRRAVVALGGRGQARDRPRGGGGGGAGRACAPEYWQPSGGKRSCPAPPRYARLTKQLSTYSRASIGPIPSTRRPTRITSSEAGTGGAVSMSLRSCSSSPTALSALQFSVTVCLCCSCTYARACARSCSARFLLSSGPVEAGSLRISFEMASGVAREPTCLYPDATIVFLSAMATLRAGATPATAQQGLGAFALSCPSPISFFLATKARRWRRDDGVFLGLGKTDGGERR
jgi:hypothetical protein